MSIRRHQDSDSKEYLSIQIFIERIHFFPLRLRAFITDVALIHLSAKFNANPKDRVVMNFGRFALRGGRHILRSLKFIDCRLKSTKAAINKTKSASKEEKMKTTMKSAIEKILSAYGILEAFQTAHDYSVKIENEGYMPLCIEKHGSQITVTHYFEAEGDLIADPDMEFTTEIDPAEWIPVAIQHSTGSYHRALIKDEDGWKVSQKQLRDQRYFSIVWARNLLQQGFAHARLVRSEIC